MLWYSCILGYVFNLKGFTNIFWRFFAFSWLAILGVIFFKCSAHISIYLEIIIISKWSFIELDKVQNPKKVKKSQKSKKSPNFNAKKRSQLGLLTFFGVWTFDFFLTLHLFFWNWTFLLLCWIPTNFRVNIFTSVHCDTRRRANKNRFYQNEQ